MFGYCRCDKDELVVKESRLYSAYYCSLCNALSRDFGFIYRFILSNDSTFLLICLDAISNQSNRIKYRCPINPFRKGIIHVNDAALHYATFVNYYLATQKCKDAIRDANNIVIKFFYTSVYRFFMHNKKYKKLSAANAKFVAEMDQAFDELAESEKCAESFDVLTNRFGEITRHIVTSYTEFTNYPYPISEMSDIFFHMGKWIYLADAMDDYHTDVRKQNFNLLQTIRLSNPAEKEMQYLKKCFIMLRLMQNKMAVAFQTINWNKSQGIIQNILFDGTTNTFLSISRTKYLRKRKDKVMHGNEAI